MGGSQQNDWRLRGDSGLRSEPGSRCIRAVGLQTAIKILQDRAISYIGVNESENSVVIFTNRVLRAKDISALDRASSSGVKVVFRHAAQIASGGPTPPQSVVPPFTLTPKAIYTCGSSISISNELTAGTLGCLLTDGIDIFGLSNNHVLASSNYAEIGIPVSIPGQVDVAANSLDPSVLGHLVRAIPLVDGNPNIVAADANVDAAIIRILDTTKISSLQRSYYDTPSKTADLVPNMRVEKIGRTTGRTIGTVVSHHVTPQPVRCVILRHNTFKLVYFNDFYGIKAEGGAVFSKPGDSGSIITGMDASGLRACVGLLFAEVMI